MIYLHSDLETSLKTTMNILSFKRNSGQLEINEYEVKNLNLENIPCGLIFKFDVVMVFEEKAISRFYKKEFIESFKENFAIQSIAISEIENNRTQVIINCVQQIDL